MRLRQHLGDIQQMMLSSCLMMMTIVMSTHGMWQPMPMPPQVATTGVYPKLPAEPHHTEIKEERDMAMPRSASTIYLECTQTVLLVCLVRRFV